MLPFACKGGCNLDTVENVRISVLLPAFNSHGTLTKAIVSTLRALGPNDELLVMIQGASKAEYSLGEIEDSRLSVYYAPESRGIVNSLNFLALKASGEFIARMDADDICMRSRFSRQIKFIKKYHLDFVFAGAILFGKQIRPFGFSFDLPLGMNAKTSEIVLPLSNPFIHPSMLARRQAIRDLGYYRNSVAEDYDLWLRAASRGFRLGRMSGFGLFYRIHPSQTTQSNDYRDRLDRDTCIAESRNSMISYLMNKNVISGEQGYKEELESTFRRMHPLIWFVNRVSSGITPLLVKAFRTLNREGRT